MDAQRLVEWIVQQINDASYRSNACPADERDHWLDIIDHLLESKNELERAIVKQRSAPRRRRS